jgi:hypothetical protein
MSVNTSSKSSDTSELDIKGYLPIALIFIRRGSWPGTLHTAEATNTVASVGSKLTVMLQCFPGSTAPDIGDNLKGGPCFQLNVAVFCPTLRTLMVRVVISPVGQKPKSSVRGTVTFNVDMNACTRTPNSPATVLNIITSSYGSYLIGRNNTSTATNIPGLSIIILGNSIEKNFVAGI